MKALITGSTKGIGKQIGIDLLNKDYFVYFNCSSYESAEELKKELQTYPYCTTNYEIIQADLSKIGEIYYLLANIKQPIDVLVLNAGITDRTQFGKIEYENWNKVFNVNLTNQFFLIQGLKDKINNNGRIIFISSISGIIPDSVSISYGVSKAAINMLVSYLAKEFAKNNITVNAIAPGYTMTSWHESKSEAQIKRISKKCLANRFGTPEEISSTVLHLIDNAFINGQIIRVDGGFIK